MTVAGLVTTTAFILSLTSAAWAGSVGKTPAEPMTEPMAQVAPASYDWSGFYAGVSAGKSTGDFSYTDFGDTSPYSTDDLSGKSYGLFGGYNFQNGNFVYGLELALQNVDAERVDYPLSHFERANDLKLRLGYAYDNVLFYAFAGRTMAKWHNYSGNFSMDGNNMGLGAEMVWRDKWLAGLEYIARDLDGDQVPAHDESISSNLNTLQLRLGYKF